MLLVSTRYINRGGDLHVRRLVANELRIGADSLLWSFQPTSTSAQADWVLPVCPGFRQENYLGMNNTDYGGGIPMVSLWRRDGGVSVGLTEPCLRTVSMPVVWSRSSDAATMSLVRGFDENCSSPGATRWRLTTASWPCSRAISSIRCAAFRPHAAPPRHPHGRFRARAFEPVWCAWGYERQFTVGEVIGTLPKVAELGFQVGGRGRRLPDRRGRLGDELPFSGRRPRHAPYDRCHSRAGHEGQAWWAPMAADPGTRILREHPEMLLQTAEGTPEYITWWDSYYLSPVNPATERYTLGLVDRFMREWNFDGLKLDGQHLNLCLPDHNPASGLDDPEQAVERFPSFFRAIFDRARAIKPDAVVQALPVRMRGKLLQHPLYESGRGLRSHVELAGAAGRARVTRRSIPGWPITAITWN